MENLFNSQQNSDTQTVTERVRSRWLQVALEHPVPVHFAVPVTFLLASKIILVYGFNLQPRLLQEVLIDLLIGVASLMLPSIITYLALRRQIHAILKLVNIGPPSVAGIVLRVITEELQELKENIDKLQSGGRQFAVGTVPKWIQDRYWATLEGPYIGTDSHLPSKFWRKYHKYLDGHQSYLGRIKHDSIRVIFADQETIEHDAEEEAEMHSKFLTWHKDNHVKLRILSPWRAKQLAKDRSTRSTTDMSCWDGEVILLWRYEGDPNQVKSDQVELEMSFVSQPCYACCRRFLADVLEEAKPFPGAAL